MNTTFRFLSGLILAVATLAAQTLTVAGPTKPVSYGSNVTLNVTLAGSGGLNIAALQGSLSVPGEIVAAPSPGTATTTAQKQLVTNPGDTMFRFLTYGINTNTYADGSVMQVQITIPALPASGIADAQQLPQTLTGLQAASLAGSSVPLTAGSPYSITVLSACDLNQDGAVDSKDVLMVIAQIFAGGGSVADLTGDGKVDLIDMQRVINAAVPGGSCKVGP